MDRRLENPAATPSGIEPVESFAEALNPCSEEWAPLLAGVGNGIDDADPPVPADVPGKEVPVICRSLRHPPVG